MSSVTNVILTFDSLEDEPARMAEVNTSGAFVRGVGFAKSLGESSHPDELGGGMNLRANIYVGAFNHLLLDDFLADLRKVAWKYPHNVRCYVKGPDDEAFDERLQTSTMWDQSGNGRHGFVKHLAGTPGIVRAEFFPYYMRAEERAARYFSYIGPRKNPCSAREDGLRCSRPGSSGSHDCLRWP